MKRALVLGLGRFGGGQEATAFLLRRGYGVRVADKADPETLRNAIAALDGGPGRERIEWRIGPSEDPESERLLDEVDLLVCNPAVPDGHPLLAAAAARGLPVTQEASLFLDSYPGRVVLVTGTNGKSTTTALLGDALAASGLDVLVGGNLGKSLLAAEDSWSAAQVAVLEISSFQLARCEPARQRACGAVLVRVTRDHLDRHGTLEAYWRAKGVAAALATEFLVHCADDPVTSAFASRARRRVRYTREAGVAAELTAGADGWLRSELPEARGRVLHADSLRLVGSFHRENALAAFGAAVLLGATPHRAALAICQRAPLPYRLQLWLEHAGKRIWDNGVSTEIESTASAVAALEGPIHWVGGGKSKDGDYARVAGALRGKIASAHLFGAAAAPLAPLLASGMSVTVSVGLAEALQRAWSHARAGEHVLFSPAFASFDQYPNFRVRAEEFRSCSRSLVAAEFARLDPAS